MFTEAAKPVLQQELAVRGLARFAIRTLPESKCKNNAGLAAFDRGSRSRCARAPEPPACMSLCGRYRMLKF